MAPNIWATNRHPDPGSGIRATNCNCNPSPIAGAAVLARRQATIAPTTGTATASTATTARSHSPLEGAWKTPEKRSPVAKALLCKVDNWRKPLSQRATEPLANKTVPSGHVSAFIKKSSPIARELAHKVETGRVSLVERVVTTPQPKASSPSAKCALPKPKPESKHTKHKPKSVGRIQGYSRARGANVIGNGRASNPRQRLIEHSSSSGAPDADNGNSAVAGGEVTAEAVEGEQCGESESARAGNNNNRWASSLDNSDSESEGGSAGPSCDLFDYEFTHEEGVFGNLFAQELGGFESQEQENTLEQEEQIDNTQQSTAQQLQEAQIEVIGFYYQDEEHSSEDHEEPVTTTQQSTANKQVQGEDVKEIEVEEGKKQIVIPDSSDNLVEPVEFTQQATTIEKVKGEGAKQIVTVEDAGKEVVGFNEENSLEDQEEPVTTTQQPTPNEQVEGEDAKEIAKVEDAHQEVIGTDSPNEENSLKDPEVESTLQEFTIEKAQSADANQIVIVEDAEKEVVSTDFSSYSSKDSEGPIKTTQQSTIEKLEGAYSEQLKKLEQAQKQVEKSRIRIETAQAAKSAYLRKVEENIANLKAGLTEQIKEAEELQKKVKESRQRLEVAKENQRKEAATSQKLKTLSILEREIRSQNRNHELLYALVDRSYDRLLKAVNDRVDFNNRVLATFESVRKEEEKNLTLEEKVNKSYQRLLAAVTKQAEIYNQIVAEEESKKSKKPEEKAPENCIDSLSNFDFASESSDDGSDNEDLSEFGESTVQWVIDAIRTGREFFGHDDDDEEKPITRPKSAASFRSTSSTSSDKCKSSIVLTPEELKAVFSSSGVVNTAKFRDQYKKGLGVGEGIDAFGGDDCYYNEEYHGKNEDESIGRREDSVEGCDTDYDSSEETHSLGDEGKGEHNTRPTTAGSVSSSASGKGTSATVSQEEEEARAEQSIEEEEAGAEESIEEEDSTELDRDAEITLTVRGDDNESGGGSEIGGTEAEPVDEAADAGDILGTVDESQTFNSDTDTESDSGDEDAFREGTKLSRERPHCPPSPPSSNTDTTDKSSDSESDSEDEDIFRERLHRQARLFRAADAEPGCKETPYRYGEESDDEDDSPPTCAETRERRARILILLNTVNGVEAPKEAGTTQSEALSEAKHAQSDKTEKADFKLQYCREDQHKRSLHHSCNTFASSGHNIPRLKLIKRPPGWKAARPEMVTSSYPDSQRRAYNHTPGDLDQDEGGASLLSDIAVPPFGAPGLLSPSPFPRLESQKRDERFVTQLHHEDEDESHYVGRAETTEGDLSMPIEHARHFLDMDSSFQANEDEESHEQEAVASPQQEEYLDEQDDDGPEQESTAKGNKASASSILKGLGSFRKADSSFGQDDDEDFDDFSMIHPEQTPSLKSRKSFFRSIIASNTNSPSALSNVSNSNKFKQLVDIPTPPLPPLSRINSRSTQRRLERSYSHTSSESKPRGRNPIESLANLPSSDSFDMSSPLPQHEPSSDTEFAPSSPIVSAQTRRKLQRSYGSDKQESQVERPPLTGRLHRSESTTSTRSAGRRPKFLRSRQSSTRSSISSVYSNAYKNEEQDGGENEDNASTLLGTKAEKSPKGKEREVSPTKRDMSIGRGRNARKDSIDRYLSDERDGSRDFYDSKGDLENFGGPLSRTTSLGSIASGVTGLGQSMVAEATGGPVKMGNRAHLDPVTEVKSGVDDDGRESDHDNPPLPPETALGADTDSEHDSDVQPEKVPLPQESPVEPRTPKRQPRMPNPSMTAISARVSEIQIPTTVAKEFYARENRPYPASTTKLQLERYGKEAKTPGKDMTLKEQNAVIDKLGKQVFDLKLRCFFLDQKLQNTSEEGMDSLRQENVELKVQLAGTKKENKLLKRQIKELKASSTNAGDDTEGDGGESDGRDVEIYELRERCERYEVEIEHLKRKIELDAVVTSGQPVDDVVDIMKEMVQEARLQTEKTNAVNEELMKEVEQLKMQLSAQQESNNYLHPPSMDRRPSTTSHSDTGASNTTTTAINSRVGYNNTASEGGRRVECAECDELRREVGAQTSMLTTRNREREQLYQEIEDLKLNMRSLRPAGSNTNIADQLGPRFQHLHHGDGTERSVSRNSFAGSSTALAEEERENMENVNGALRDKISELKIAKADLELQLSSAIRELQEMDVTNEQRQLAYEQEITLLNNNQRDLEDMIGDLTRERNELLGMYEQKSIDFDDLREEAEEELERLEIQIISLRDQQEEYRKALSQKMDDNAALQEDYDAMQREIRAVSDHAVAMEDKVVGLQEKINELEKEKTELDQELERGEKKFREEEANTQRLNVQLESSQGQIAFLNEELDGDKIRIGQLETNLSKAEEQVREERERSKDWERRCAEEKKRVEKERERRTGDTEGVKDLERRLTDREKDVFQKDDELRRLRKTIAKREEEAKQWRDRLEEVEGALREALGDVTGTKENLLESITKLQAQLDATLEELDATKRRLGERERTLRDRESMLEAMAIETKKLSEILEKERNDRKQTKKEVDNLENKNHHHRQRLSQSEIQYKELERTRNREVRNFQNDEQRLREQISERNNLLIAVWARISVLPGPEFAHRHSHVTTAVAVAGAQQGKMSMESAVAQAFVAFSRHMMNGVKAIETVIAQFKTKVRQVDRDLMKEYQLLESALESRTRRLERLETLVRGGLGESAAVRTEVAKLRTENRQLKAEMTRGGGVTGTPPQQATKDGRRKSVVPNVERLSQVFDAAVNNSGNGNAAASSGGAGPSNSNNVPESVQRTNTTTTHTTEKVTTKSTASKARDLITGAFNRSTKSPAATSTPPPAVNNNNTPASPQPRPAASTAATNASVIVTEPQDDTQGGGELGDGTDPVTQKRWIHRLRELERRLKSEREARIIDRSGAKRRIEEELQEKEALRKELERERERWSGLEVPGVEGVKERLSIEDVKRDNQPPPPQQSTLQQQPQQPQQHASSQQTNTNAFNTGSVRGREPRERRGSVSAAGDHKPRKSSRSRHRTLIPSSSAPIAGPSSEGGAGVNRPRGPNPEEQEMRSQSLRERGISRSRAPIPEGFQEHHARRERGASRHRSTNEQEETREERRERKEREREERRIRKEREGQGGSLRGDKRGVEREVGSPVNSGSGGGM